MENLSFLEAVALEGEPFELINDVWLEYRGCRIPAVPGRVRLKDFTPTEQSLIKAIRPQSAAAIRLLGGLTAPDRQAGWMEGYLPRAVLEMPTGFAEFKILNLQTREAETVTRVAANDPLDLPSLAPGFYRIEATILSTANAADHTRFLPPQILSIRSWDSLACARLASEPV
jgi:hypothetical protein